LEVTRSSSNRCRNPEGVSPLIVSTFNNGTLVRANDPVADASAAAIVKVAALKAQEAVSATLLRVSSPSAQDTL